MARYVDKAVEEVRLNYCKNCNSYNGIKCRACAFDDAMLEIEDTITADVVEVVRCCDCKYWQDKNSKGTQGICLCGEKDMNYGGEFYPFSNDFCSYGERKEVDQMNFFKRLFCKHEYKYKEQMFINAGMRKMIVYKCEKCGKEKCKFV